MEKQEELNIQPQAGVIGVFSRLNYKAWYAIAEFVDNSTQSFFNHRKELETLEQTCVHIEIHYDDVANTLTITDNAFGMGHDDFLRAVKLDSKPKDQSGRNEFGMGLKTAASWFGDIWCVQSTELGSHTLFSTEVNIPQLRLEEKNSVFIISNECETTAHGTTITIRDVTKRIDAPRTICKIREVLESMYRRDILSGDVEIIFNGEELSFKEYEALSFRKRVWKKEVSFDVVFRDRNYKVNGFVGILNNGSFSRAGFALFRRGRVVIGGDDMNYKPHDIYGQSQSPISHKLYGELDLEDFEINQAKDGFVWDDGLEDEFISKLKENIQEYIDIAKLTNKERAKEIEFSESTSDEIQHNVSELLATVPFDISITDPIKNASPINEDIPPHANDLDAYKQAILPQAEPSVPFTVAKPREYNVQLNSVTTIKLLVKWEIGQKTKWISVNDTINEIEITININHPFFKPYSEEKEFKEVLEKFVIAFVLAEREAKITSTEKGMILESSIQTNLNKFLERFSK